MTALSGKDRCDELEKRIAAIEEYLERFNRYVHPGPGVGAFERETHEVPGPERNGIFVPEQNGGCVYERNR